MLKSFGKKLRLYVALVLTAAAIVFVGNKVLDGRANYTYRVTSKKDRSGRLAIELKAGLQLQMVLLGSSKCGANRGSLLVQAISRVRDSVQKVAENRGLTFSYLGAALDSDPNEGLRWLEQVGEFDEVSAGERWLNSTAVQFFWRDSTSLAATPQIVILIRSIELAEERLSVSNAEILVRMMGPGDVSRMLGLNDLDSLIAVKAHARRGKAANADSRPAGFVSTQRGRPIDSRL